MIPRQSHNDINKYRDKVYIVYFAAGLDESPVDFWQRNLVNGTKISGQQLYHAVGSIKELGERTRRNVHSQDIPKGEYPNYPYQSLPNQDGTLRLLQGQCIVCESEEEFKNIQTALSNYITNQDENLHTLAYPHQFFYAQINLSPDEFREYYFKRDKDKVSQYIAQVCKKDIIKDITKYLKSSFPWKPFSIGQQTMQALDNKKLALDNVSFHKHEPRSQRHLPEQKNEIEVPDFLVLWDRVNTFINNSGDISKAIIMYQDAIILYQDAYKKHKKPEYMNGEYKCHFQCGYIYYKNNQHTEAIQQFDLIISNSSHVTESTLTAAYFYRGHIHQKQGKYKQAIVDYQEAEERYKTNDDLLVEKTIHLVRLYLYRSKVRQEQHHLDLSMEDCKKAMQVLKSFYKGSGLYIQEIEEFRKALYEQKNSVKATALLEAKRLTELTVKNRQIPDDKKEIFIEELNQYIKTRNLEGGEYHPFSFFGRLAGFSLTVKTKAAQKMIDHLEKKEPLKEFSTLELAALRDSRLGKIISKYEIKLPDTFKNAENAKVMRENRNLI